MHTECRSTRVLSGYSRPAILVLAVLLSGCALFQPYRNVTAYPPDSEPQWQDINSAAQICRAHLDYPPLSIHAVRVDLQAQNLNIAVYPSAPSEATEEQVKASMGPKRKLPSGCAILAPMMR